MDSQFIEPPETETIVGKPLHIGDRILYPIVQISKLKDDSNFYGAWISPLAIVVVEAEDKYVLFLTDEDLDSDELLQMVSSIKDR
jgi:uncharacterized spore protein YtfJ